MRQPHWIAGTSTMGAALRASLRPLPDADHGVPIAPVSFPPAPIPCSSFHRLPATASPGTILQSHQKGKPMLKSEI